MADSILSGRLGIINLAEIAQFLGNCGLTGKFLLQNSPGPEKGVVFFFEGRPVYARSGELEGEEAFYRFFQWQEARFSFSPEARQPEHNLFTGLMELVINGSRLEDEAAPESPQAFAGPGLTLPLLSGSAPTDRSLIETRHFPKGFRLERPGGGDQWIGILLSGKAGLVMEGKAEPFGLMKLGPGALVGNASHLLRGKNRPMAAVSVGNVQVGFWDFAELLAEFRGASEDLVGLLISLERRFFQVASRLKDLQKGHADPTELLEGKRKFMSQGDAEDRLFRIKTGTAVIARENQGQKIPLAILGKGDALGQMPFFPLGQEPGAASVYGSKDLAMAPLDTGALTGELESLSPAARFIVQQVSARISVTTCLFASDSCDLAL